MADRKEGVGPRRVLALGATSAIAQATLRLMAAQHAVFFIVGRNAQKLAAVRDDLLTRGASAVTAVVADLDDTAEHPALLAQAVSALDGIDVALLAHGVLGEQPAAEMDYATTEAVLRTNFLSPVSLVTWLANYMEQGALPERSSGNLKDPERAVRAGAGLARPPQRDGVQHRGTIAVISSVAGDRGRKSNYVYGASKGGLNIFLDGVRNRVDRAGVQVLTIKPGFVATPMTAHLKKSALFAEPARVGKDIVRAIDRRKDVIYTPHFWWLIMLAVRGIPRRIFKRMNM